MREIQVKVTKYADRRNSVMYYVAPTGNHEQDNEEEQSGNLVDKTAQ